MLEKPDFPDEKIITCLREEYDLRGVQITFLPLGADLNTAVYRAVTAEQRSYFVKLRRGEFNPAGAAVPRYLADHGLWQVIPPLPARSGQLWTRLPPYNLILYPYVEGHHGYEQKMSAQQWREFGAALKQLHTTPFPAAVTSGLPQETFSPRWRSSVRLFLDQIETQSFDEPAAAELAAFLRTNRQATLNLIHRAERCAQILLAQPLNTVLCHADIHGWNLLIDQQDALYIVDWDTLLFALKERDLMFIGGGPGDSGYTPQEEEDLFYRGYGPASVDPTAMAYYRYERIIEDIAVYCEQLLTTDEGGEDRNQSLVYLKSNFLPGGTIAKAYQADQTYLFEG